MSPIEKLTDAITFKCSPEFKDLVTRLAVSEDMDVSEFIRKAIEHQVEERRERYLNLAQIFCNTRKDQV